MSRSFGSLNENEMLDYLDMLFSSYKGVYIIDDIEELKADMKMHLSTLDYSQIDDLICRMLRMYLDSGYTIRDISRFLKWAEIDMGLDLERVY